MEHFIKFLFVEVNNPYIRCCNSNETYEFPEVTMDDLRIVERSRSTVQWRSYQHDPLLLTPS